MEKFKILIADDEYWTREKLVRMIDWESYGLTLLEPAQDGEEVLRRMAEERADILITDINMPFLNGVDLLQIIQKEYPDTIPFVVSGYDDFEYVKESFMAGSINYLVKPVSRIDLVNALVKALGIVAKRNNEKQELLRASSYMQDREFSALLEQREMAITPDITMNSLVDFTGAKLMLIKIHNMNGLAGNCGYDMNLLSFRLKEKIKELVDTEDVVIFNHTFRSNEFILVSEEDSKKMMLYGERIQNVLEDITGSAITIVLNENICSMDNIYQAYVQAVSLLMTRIFNQQSTVLCSSKIETNFAEGKVGSRINEAQMQELRTLWKSGNGKAIRQMIFEQIGLKHCEEQNWKYLEVKQTLRRILNTWEECVADSAQTQKSMEYESMVEVIDIAVEKLNAKYMCELLEDMIILAEDVHTEDCADNTGQLIRQAAAYIDKYYYEPLTLSGLAEKYHMENSYFSRMFRKEIGENFIHYLSRTRIEKAKELMLGGDVNLTEIAFMVGYDDYTYFNKVFRKLTGISPREYRQNA